MTTNLNYPKPVNPDDGCNWLPVILWRMNAGARARSRSVFVAAPRPDPVPGITPQKPIKREIIAPTVSGRRRKTHIGTVIYSRGEKNVRLSEGATAWSAGSNEHFDKKRASESAVLAVTVWCWRVSAHCRPATNSRMLGASPRSSW